MKKNFLTFLFGTIVGATCLIIIFFYGNDKIAKIHILKEPMILSSNASTKNLHLLPVGTTLYYDRSYAEGFTRYRVYINIDRMPLTLVELDDSTEIAPIDARALEKSDLIKALRDYPLTRDDLESILQTRHLSKQEIKEILMVYHASAE